MRIYGLWEELSKIIFRSNTRKVTVEPASQTTGDSTITIPDMAGTTQQAILSSQSQTLTNKTIDSDLNTITNIVDADIKSTAAIARSKVAAGTVNHVLINDGSGNFSSEATLATTRGGTGQNSSATFPTSGTVLTRTSADQAGNRLTNKDLDDTTTQVVDTADTSKVLKFNVTGTTGTSTTVTTAQTANRVLTLPDATDTVVGRQTTDTLTNKSLDSDTNTLSNIKDSDIKAAAAIARTKLASGTLNHVIINDGTGVLSSEAQLATTRGGTGVNSSATFPSSGTILTRTSADQGANRLTNKDLEDATTQIVDSTDTTKAIKFDAVGTTATSTTITSSQTASRVLTLPDATDTLVGKATTDILTNKSIDSDNNTITNIKNADIKAGAAIARTKLASGTADHVLINDGTGVASSEASLAISRGGTGQATATAGFNALSPNTTKGDLVGFNGTNNVRVAVGADGQVLAADSASATGLSWSSPLVNPMDSPGDLIVGSTGGAAARLDHPGVAGQVLATTGASTTAWTAGPSLTTVTTSGLGTLGSAKVSNLSTGVVHSNGTGDLTSSLVVNADVSASAAIAYSKLSLTGSIVNADVNASAAIAGSKISPNFGHQDVTGDRITSSGTARTSTRHSWTFPSGNASYIFGGDALGTNTFDLYNVTANRYLLSYIEGSQQLTLGDSNQTGSTILAGGNLSTTAATYIGDASNTAILSLTAPSTGGVQLNITRSGNNTIRMGHQISTSNTFDIYDITNGQAIITYGTSTQNLTISNGITGSTTIKGPGGLNLIFPATAVSSNDANTLDDYEEGVWTPTWVGSSSGSLAVSTSQVSRYVKIGKTVFFKTYMQGISGTLSTLVGAVGFTLPFTSDSTTNNYSAVTISQFNYGTTGVWYGAYLPYGSNYAYLLKMTSAAGTPSSMAYTDLAASSYIGVSGWFQVTT